jgi:hypothetical protein
MSQNSNKLLPGILLGFVIGAGGMWFMNRNMSQREVVKEEVTTETSADSLEIATPSAAAGESATSVKTMPTSIARSLVERWITRNEGSGGPYLIAGVADTLGTDCPETMAPLRSWWIDKASIQAALGTSNSGLRFYIGEQLCRENPAKYFHTLVFIGTQQTSPGQQDNVAGPAYDFCRPCPPGCNKNVSNRLGIDRPGTADDID